MVKRMVAFALFATVLAMGIALYSHRAATQDIDPATLAGMAAQAQAQGESEVNFARDIMAKEFGSYREIQAPTRTATYQDLADLVRHSTAVIIGTPQNNTPILSSDGKRISLAYSVRVEYVYKGTLREGNTLVVSLPGGRLKFDDGRTAEIQTPWLKKMQNGKTYALFLTQVGANGSFITTGDGQGIFEIPTTPGTNVVQSHSGIVGDAVRKYQGRSVKAFLQELRQVTNKPLRT
jgi:hypothetical protein